MTDFSNYCLGGINSSVNNCVWFVGEWAHQNKTEAAAVSIFLALITGVAGVAIKKAAGCCLDKPGRKLAKNEDPQIILVKNEDPKPNSNSLNSQDSQSSKSMNFKKLNNAELIELNYSFEKDHPDDLLFAAKFYEAIAKGDINLLKTAEKHQIDITKPLNGRTVSPLEFACLTSNQSVVAALIEIGKIGNLEELEKCCESAINAGGGR